MQILSIRGANIASLAMPFEIRLDVPPLASSGLFAITGETGAGKSSLLDAMCLALYDDCPRLSGEGTSETVEDVGGRELQSTDTRMVLRRGAATGYAEVTFRGVDGEIYTAGWRARRARDRVDGRLQSIDRSLVRVSDGQMLETQPTRVNKRVVALTGLTYDEFRRTVLLAQGDFAAFLDAKTKSRAAILEKVTGTGIYRDISRRVFERNREATAALATLETRRAEHQILSREARDEIEASIAAQRVAQKAAAQEADTVQAGLARYAGFAAAEASLAAATARVIRAGEARAALSEDRRWLADWERAQALRGEARELRDAARALVEAQQAREAHVAEYHRQAADETTAREGLEAAKAAQEDAERSFKIFAPVWNEAAALDSRIAAAAEEHAVASKTLIGLRNIEAERRAVRDRLGERHQTLTETAAARQVSIDEIEGHAALLADWGVIEEGLAARIDQLRQAERAEAEARDGTATIAADRARRQALDGEIKSAGARIEAARLAQDGVKDERKRLADAAPAARLERLAEARADLHALRHAGQDVRLADEAVSASGARRLAAEQSRAEQSRVLAEARAQQTAALRLVESLRQPANAAAAAASREAAHLRQHLVDGAACPVCGAKDHPLMADGEIARLAEDLRARLSAAQAERDDANTAAAAAGAQIAAADETIAAERDRLPALAAARADAEAGFARALEPLKGGPLAGDLAGEMTDDPHAPDAVFEALQVRLSDRRQALERDRNRLETLDTSHREAVRAIDIATGEIARCATEIREIDTRISSREKTIAKLELTGETARASVSALDRKLAPLLAPTALSPATFGPDAEPRLDDLRAQIEALRRAARDVAAAEKEIGKLAADLAAARADLSSAEANRAQAERVVLERQTALDELRASRAALLDGEDTGAHRSRHNDARVAAQKSLEAAQERFGTATRVRAAAESTSAAAQVTERRAETRITAARSALSKACAMVGLETENVEALHGVDDTTVALCRARLSAADTEQANAEGARKDRADELATLKARGLPEVPEDQLVARKTALEAEMQARGEVLGRLAQQLDADTKAAAALAGLEAEVDAARKIVETWAAVNDAVGSAQGDRFAQIAQSVTLALLVDRANHHLRDLNPRYRLKVAASDLALHVIDRDMAGDARPTRLLSGGERFLVSLALALALSGLGTRGALAGTLFIDEGFGSLDFDSLDLALDALERLQAQGRTIGVISHVQAMKDRIPIQVQVAKTGGGASDVRLVIR